MVWSEQVGVSIVVPSDRQQGDGRHYIVIGEDIPVAISDQFTAALVFHNGKYVGPDPVPGTNTNVPNVGDLYPSTFLYWALGISKAGNLELVAFYATVQAQDMTTFRHTIFSASPPVAIDGAPVFYLGHYDPAYSTYGEGALAIKSVQIDPIVPKTVLTVNAAYFAPLGAPWQVPCYWKTATGIVHVIGVMTVNSASFSLGTVIATLPVGCRPSASIITIQLGWNNGGWRCDVDALGRLIYSAAIPGTTVGVGQFLAFNLSFMAEQ
jgi:hypothetical protein